MAKRKAKNRPQRKRPVVMPCESRIKAVVFMYGAAGGMVLQEHFDFTQEQAQEWAKLTLGKTEELIRDAGNQ